MSDQLRFALDDMDRKIGLQPRDTRQITGAITGDYERFTIEGESTSKRSGAIIFFEDGGYWAQNHKTGQICSGRYGYKGEARQVRRSETPKKTSDEAQSKAMAKQARHIYTYGHAVDVTFADEGHPYLVRKKLSGTGILSCQDCHMEYRRDWIMFPLLNLDGFVNIQFIAPDGSKRFMKGAKKKGTFGKFGLYEKGMPVILTEGAATARSLYEILKMPVFFGLDAGNLPHALKTIIEKYEVDTRLTQVAIAADYDEKDGIGEKKGREALRANFIPINQDSLIIPGVNISTDWNDIAVYYRNAEQYIRDSFESTTNKSSITKGQYDDRN